MGALTQSMCLGISALRMPPVSQQLSLEGRQGGIQTCAYHTTGNPMEQRIVHQLGIPYCCPERFLCTHYSPSQVLSCVDAWLSLSQSCSVFRVWTISDIPEVTVPYLPMESPGADEETLYR